MSGDQDGRDPGPPRPPGAPLTTKTGPYPDRLEVVFRPDADAPPRLSPPTAPPASPTTPEAPVPPAAPRHRVRNGILSLLLVLVAQAGLWASLLLRSEGVRPWRVLWAEDGSRFLLSAVQAPGPGSWLDPYAGYRHVVPRMIGDLAAQFPLIHAAKIFAVASTGVAAAALIVFGLGLKRWLPSLWMRIGLVAAVGLTHAMASEISANAANLHWYLTLGLIGLALRRPARIWSALLLALLAAAFALSDPFSPFVAVLALLDATRRSWTTRTQVIATWPVALAITGGGAVQVYTMLTSPRTGAAGVEPGWYVIADQYVTRVIRDGIGPELLIRYSLDTLVVGVAVVATVLVVLAVVVAGARRGPGGHAALGVLLIACSPLLFGLDLLINHVAADRYAAVPAALLVAGLLVLAAGVPKAGTVLFSLACAGVIALGVSSWHTDPIRGQGPDYVNAVRVAARDDCPTPTTIVRIGVAPVRGKNLPPWVTLLPCGELLDGTHSLPRPLDHL